ncbi:MAG TPA: enoyl-CoA hydratase/isomerase family protein [Acidimicrobiales bacterium]|nr:enoyl-CoA hydratase/isomerase family protein [Acidimicrobiales bacterium]
MGERSVGIDVDGHVGLVEMRRPPHNFLSPGLVETVADALEAFGRDVDVRCAVLAAEGRSFCAGADFGGGERGDDDGSGPVGAGTTERLYAAAARLCGLEVPFVAAVHGPAIGGGLGLAMTANLRVTCPEARFSANFAKLGIHQGFGLSVTLPEQLGPSRAARVLLGGRRYNGEEAVELGLADRCVPAAQVREAALELAREIAENAPLAVRAINRTLRRGLADRVREATRREAQEQLRLSASADAAEGVRAVAERRPGNFAGR